MISLHDLASRCQGVMFIQHGIGTHNGKFVDPANMISVVSQKGTDKVVVRLSDIVEILYQGKDLSVMEVVSNTFYIDQQGNHSPIDKVRFGGVMGDQRMGDALPNDYLLQPVSKN